MERFFNWNEITALGADVGVYWVMALTGTALFLIRLGFTALGGDIGDDAGGLDLDLEAGGHSDAVFSFFSTLSILAFFMGAGWMGLACRLDWHLGSVASALSATGFGLLLMGISSSLMWATRRLNSEAKVDPSTAIGRTARVYLPIPARGQGHGQVEVSVSGRRKIMRAASNGPALAAFEDAVVVEVQDDDCLVVTPKYPAEDASVQPPAEGPAAPETE